MRIPRESPLPVDGPVLEPQADGFTTSRTAMLSRQVPSLEVALIPSSGWLPIANLCEHCLQHCQSVYAGTSFLLLVEEAHAASPTLSHSKPRTVRLFNVKRS